MEAEQLVAPPTAPDTLVDVQLLIDRPKAALVGVLRLLEGWESASKENITVEQFSGAMTNLVYRCGLQEGGKETQLVLMRVHASASDLFNRAAEVATFQSVSAAGLGPRLLLLFGNGRVEQFLAQHVTLAAADLHEPAVSEAIAHAVAHFHARMSEALAGDPHHQGPVQLWGRLHAWHKLAQEHCSAEELQQMGMGGLDEEITQLQQALCSAHPCWVAACHNDLQYGNIMAPAGPAAAAAGGAAAASSATAPAGDNAAAAAGLSQQLGSLGIHSADAATGAAAVGHTVATAAALQQHHEHQQTTTGSSTAHGTAAFSAAAAAAGAAAAADPAAAAGSSSGLVRGHSIDSLPSEATDFSGVALAGNSPTPSVASLPAKMHESGSASSLNLRGRSPANMQLPDGSLVLPGMKARPRGQSPERGKRPDSFSNALGAPGLEGLGLQQNSTQAAAAGSGGSTADGLASAASFGSHAELGAAVGAAGLQPPSAAAVLRHTPSAGELFVSAGIPAAAGAGPAAAAAEAQGLVHRRGRISTSGLDTAESAEDSEDGDAILPMPLHTALGSPTAAEAAEDVPARSAGRSSGSSSSRGAAAARRPVEDGRSEVAEDAAAAAARGASYYRRLRRERRKPAAGIEFPTFKGSDVDSSSGSSSDCGSCSGDDDGGSAAPCTVGKSSLSDAEQRRDSCTGHHRGAGGSSSSINNKQLAAAAAAGAAASGGIRVPRTIPDGGAGSPTTAAAAAAADVPGEAAEASQPVLLTLIDYEYSGFNPVAFDIANHWCEWAADYHTQEPHVLDFNKVPDEQQRRAFVEAYLRELLEGLGITIAEGDAALGYGHASAGAVGGAAGVRFAGVLEAASGGGLKLGGRGAGGSSGGGGSIQDEVDERESVEGMSIWSTMSSRGGSVLSMPVDTDASTYADSTSWETCSETASQCSSKGGWQQQQQLQLAGEGVKSPSAATAATVASAELRSVWSWLELHQPDRRLLANTRQLDVACFSRLIGSLMAASGAYMACSHLLWALWGVIQSRISDVDFDFEGYGVQRWQQYLLTRPAGLQHR